MVTGVVVVEFRQTKTAPTAFTLRVLVRNADNLHEAIVRGVSAAIELQPKHTRQYRATAIDFVRCDVDAVA